MAARRSVKCETEIKLRVRDIVALSSALRRLGARSRGRVLERNTLYDTPHQHFRNASCLLRVREETPAGSRLARGGQRRVLITYKTPLMQRLDTRSRYKQNMEREVAAASAGSWVRALKEVGLRAAFRYEKYRTTYRIGAPGLRDLHIDLDETPVGNFLELEGEPKAIDRLARRLGFDVRDYSRETYWDLYAAECKRRGKIPRNMLFSE